jgi:hypothetical protein
MLKYWYNQEYNLTFISDVNGHFLGLTGIKFLTETKGYIKGNVFNGNTNAGHYAPYIRCPDWVENYRAHWIGFVPKPVDKEPGLKIFMKLSGRSEDVVRKVLKRADKTA